MGSKASKSTVHSIESIMGEDGKLAEKVAGYAPREAQIAMAQQIAQMIEEGQTLLAEAGTGTGKTFAYLIPSLLSGKKVIVSTATKTLQEQLVHKDLPLLFKVCGVKGQAHLLKGRDNYVCAQRLEVSETAEHHSKEDWKKLSVIRNWLEDKTKTGDRAEVGSVAEDDMIWRKVTARMEFCQSAECNVDCGCFYPKQKEQAQDAQVLVVNHHLFCADLALREQGFGEILPEADVYIFDEAHQLPDIAAQFLGFAISRGQLDELVRDIKQAQKLEAPETQSLSDQAVKFEEQIKAVSDALGKWEKRWTWEQLEAESAFQKNMDRLLQTLNQLTQHLKEFTDRGKQLGAVHKRCKEFERQLKDWTTSTSENKIRWLESSQGRFKFNLTPLSVADPFSRQREEIGGAWLFTSATLSIHQKFDYFAKRLGLLEAQEAVWKSPFDYQTQGVIYHPIGLPQPNDPNYIKVCLRAAWPLLKAADGCAFLLFTSYRALREAREILSKHWPGKLLVQGEQPKSELLATFKSSQQVILLGTSSFWEGVDVKGDALRLVMIDRIPFIPPDDPIVQAREASLKERGLNAFVHFQLPEATIAMKQGAGRLIRDGADRGVLMLCDPRFSSKNYGKQIINSLPDFPWVYDVKQALPKLLSEQD